MQRDSGELFNFDPSVSVLEEIGEHEAQVNGGTFGFGYDLASLVFGNQGYLCTVTVECQGTCRQ
jgi:hypothetical protein